MKAATGSCCIGAKDQLKSAFNASQPVHSGGYLFFALASMTSFIRPRFSQSLRCFARAVLLLPVGEIDFFEGRSLLQKTFPYNLESASARFFSVWGPFRQLTEHSLQVKIALPIRLYNPPNFSVDWRGSALATFIPLLAPST